MILVVLLACSLTANVFLTWILWRLVVVHDTTTADKRMLTERLLNAHKDGYFIPPEPGPSEPAVEEEPLIPELQALVDDWESDSGRKAQLAVIRKELATGAGPMEVFRRLAPAEAIES